MTTFSEIKARRDKATQGTWLASINYLIGGWWVQTEEQRQKEQALADFMRQEDAEFIAHAATDVPLLLRALELAIQFDIPDDFDPAHDHPDYWLELAAKESGE